jgi:hypothetical protein
MGFMIGRLVFLLLPAIFLGGPADRIREALVRGMDYMIRSASDPENFEEYASDYLFFFADVSRFEDPWIREQARAHGFRLGNVYLEEMFDLECADDVVDAASVLWALDIQGKNVDVSQAVLRWVAPRFPLRDYLGFEPWVGRPDLDLLIDLLIGFHFTDRVGVPVGVSFAEVLLFVPAAVYLPDAEVGGDRYVDQNNLVTHLVYTLSGYAGWEVSAELLPREFAYIKEQFPVAVMWADPETLAEFIDSLKLMGEWDPLMDQAVLVLLSLQKPDGRWEPVEVEDEYDRYHATWCVMDALRSYRLGRRGPDDAIIMELLVKWARQFVDGAPFDPIMSIEPSAEVP